MYEELFRVAVEAARSGGRLLEGYFGDADLEAEEKTKNDYVSRADRDSEATIVSLIADSFPDHRILAEEGGIHQGAAEAEFEWILDPLDGTNNFLRGVPFFCVSVACRRDGETVLAVIFDPLRGDLFTAVAGEGSFRNGGRLRVSPAETLEGSFLATGFPFKAHPALRTYLELFHDLFLGARAIRRCGSAALDLAYTAAGVFDGFFEFRLAPWDLAAGCHLIEEAGGVVSDLDGQSGYLLSGNVLAGAPAIHAALLEIVARHTSESDLNRQIPRVAQW